MNDYLLDVRNVYAGYGEGKRYREILRDVSFTLREGELLGLVGESGCGKTTLSKTLLGFIEPKKGEVLREGSARMIFQNPASSLNPAFTALGLLEEPLRAAGVTDPAERKRRAVQTALQCELEERLLSSRPTELSGGQQQRLAIAAALVTEPRILIADEPVSALDVTVAAGILQLLRRLRDEKKFGVLFISHDLHVVRRLCENVLVMEKGRVVESGLVERVFFRPQEAYTKKLLSAVL